VADGDVIAGVGSTSIRIITGWRSHRRRPAGAGLFAGIVLCWLARLYRGAAGDPVRLALFVGRRSCSGARFDQQPVRCGHRRLDRADGGLGTRGGANRASKCFFLKNTDRKRDREAKTSIRYDAAKFHALRDAFDCRQAGIFFCCGSRRWRGRAAAPCRPGRRFSCIRCRYGKGDGRSRSTGTTVGLVQYFSRSPRAPSRRTENAHCPRHAWLPFI